MGRAAAQPDPSLRRLPGGGRGRAARGPRAAGACGAWSAKDVVGHAAGWDREAASRLATIRADPRVPDRSYDVDAFNAAAVSSRRHLGWGDALAELADAHTALAALLAAVSAEEAARDGRFAEWAAGRAGDYREHAAELRALA